jgi:hypothetical protein
VSRRGVAHELVGRRVELVMTSDEWTDLSAGEHGTVELVDSLGTLHVRWDNGSTLGLVPGVDRWRYLDQQGER